MLKIKPLTRYASLTIMMGISIIYGLWHIRHSQSKIAIDFFQYWLVGKSTDNLSIENIYTPEQNKIISEYFIKPTMNKGSRHYKTCSRKRLNRLTLDSTPFLYSVFHLFQTGNFDIDYQAYRVISLLFYFTGILIFWFQSRSSLVTGVILMSVFSIFFYPLNEDIRNGGTTQIQLGLLAIASLLLENKSSIMSLLGFMLLALGSAFKPTLAVAPLLLWIMETDKKKSILTPATLGIFYGTVISILVPFIMGGKSYSWIMWFEYILSRHFGVRHTFPGILGLTDRWIFPFLLIVLIGLIYMGIRRKTNSQVPRNSSLLTFIVIAPLIFLLSSPLVHPYYLILTIPSIMFLSKRQGAGGRRRKMTSTFSLFLITLLLAYPPNMHWFSIREVWPILSKYIAVIMLFLIALFRNLSAEPFDSGYVQNNKSEA